MGHEREHSAFVSFELTDAELQELRGAGWGRGRTDLMCQTIVRDYLRRLRFKQQRAVRRVERAERLNQEFGQPHRGHDETAR